MIACPDVSKKAIRHHYDLATLFYRLLWGPHIHHGLWDEELSPLLAQRRLIDRLASAARLRQGERVLDIGCGMGGSSIELAARYGCTVTGVTISPVQRYWAALSATCRGLGRTVDFCCADAEELELPASAFHVLWVVECSEHFFDKPAFFRHAAPWLAPRGRVALCAWLAGHAPGIEDQVRAVGQGFLCPSFGTAEDYHVWLESAGLVVRAFADLTPQVSRTWEICRRRVRASGVGWLAPLGGRRMRLFINRFIALRDAYRSGAMRYGLFVAEKKA